MSGTYRTAPHLDVCLWKRSDTLLLALVRRGYAGTEEILVPNLDLSVVLLCFALVQGILLSDRLL